MPLADDHRYTVISADCHAGANVADYRPYLESGYHEAFDTWVAGYENPYDDVKGADADRNWDSDRRLGEMHADGIVAEVVFPNTIPPFFPKVSLVSQPPGAGSGDLDSRMAGIRAHNRWLADFCSAAPGQRAGIAQIMLHDVEAAVDEINWVADNGLTGGVLLPGAPPGSGVPPLYAPDYEPIWAACAERGLPITHHGGSAAPDMGPYPEANVIFLLEVTWWAHRTLWHLIMAGVMERHPDLQFVFTEQGSAWIPEELTRLDYYHDRMSKAVGSQEQAFGGDVMSRLSLKPSEYFARQCHLGSSFIRQHEVAMRHTIGTDRIMWGSDFPHLEGCWPFSKEHIAMAFGGVDPDEVAAMVGGNAAEVYRLDLGKLAPLAARYGPTVAEVSAGLAPSDIPPEGLRCPAFAQAKMLADQS